MNSHALNMHGTLLGLMLFLVIAAPAAYHCLLLLTIAYHYLLLIIYYYLLLCVIINCYILIPITSTRSYKCVISSTKAHISHLLHPWYSIGKHKYKNTRRVHG